MQVCFDILMNYLFSYTTLKHNPEEKNKDRFEVLKQGHLYYKSDGLNNIE